MKGSPNKFIGIDIGNNTGVAILDFLGHCVYAETWKNKKPKDNPCDRWNLFYARLSTLLYQEADDRTVLGYEMVRRHVGTQAGHIYGGYKAQLESVMTFFPNVAVHPVEIAKWKKNLTGKGNATKEQYIAAANKVFDGEWQKKDEDICAALGVANYLYDLNTNDTDLL